MTLQPGENNRKDRLRPKNHLGDPQRHLLDRKPGNDQLKTQENLYTGG